VTFRDLPVIFIIFFTRCIKNIKFCILPELSVVVTWSHCDASNTKIVKFSIDTESQLVLKSTDLVPVAGTVNSLHFLKGDKKQVLNCDFEPFS
jgi:hypothetical protein